MSTVKVLRSFEDADGVMTNYQIRRYGSDPLDVVEQFNNKADYMFSPIPEGEDIPDAENKLMHKSGIVITKDGYITDEYIGHFDMAKFDERICNLAIAKEIKVVTTKEYDLKVGDTIVDVKDLSVRTFNG